MKVAVIAGTPIDTAMGVRCLEDRDPSLEIVACPVAPDPIGCHMFEISSAEHKADYFRDLFERQAKEGVRDFFVYCNSLSATFDFEALADQMGVNVVTPLQAYRQMGAQYGRIAVIAANNQSTAGIERSFYQGNPDIQVMGMGYLVLVDAVESQAAPASIVADHALPDLMRFFEANGAEAVVLGCTHFPYFKEDLAAVTSLPVLDPADTMYRRLVGCSADPTRAQQ